MKVEQPNGLSLIWVNQSKGQSQSLVRQSVPHFVPFSISWQVPAPYSVYSLLWNTVCLSGLITISPHQLALSAPTSPFLLSSAPAHRVPGDNMECHSTVQTLYRKSFLTKVLRSTWKSIFSSVLSSFCIFLEAAVLDWHHHSQMICSLAKPFVKWVAGLNGFQGLPGSKAESMFEPSPFPDASRSPLLSLSRMTLAPTLLRHTIGFLRFSSFL